MDNNYFIDGLREMRLDILEKCPKADLHNHASRGGNICDYLDYFGIETIWKPERFTSLNSMEKWYKENISFRFSPEFYPKRLEWAFNQIKRDGITLAIMTFGLAELELFKSFNDFMEIVNTLKDKIIPYTTVIPELGISSGCDVKQTVYNCEKIFEHNYFRSIDISGNEMIDPADYLPIYKIAEAHRIRKRAHVGEFGCPHLIRKAIDILGLDEINHGINAVFDSELIKIIKERNIRLNICPASNIQLGLSKNYKVHPMRSLFDNGIDITINTDDMLIFNVSISQLYFDLYNNGIFDENELNDLRENSLNYEEIWD